MTSPTRARVSQNDAVRAAAAAGPNGVTVKELTAAHPGAHHGQVSGALSNAHKAGRLVRLANGKRMGAAVYTTPEWQQNRKSVPHTSSKTTPAPPQECQVRRTAEAWLSRGRDGWSAAGKNPKGFVQAMREALEGR